MIIVKVCMLFIHISPSMYFNICKLEEKNYKNKIRGVLVRERWEFGEH